METIDDLEKQNSILNNLIGVKNLQKKKSLHVNNRMDTIPIILFNKELSPFEAFGNIGDVLDDDYGCFSTNFFRVENVNRSLNCVKLSLLRPIDEDGCIADSINKVFRLEKTNFFTLVNINCFCGIECLDSMLVGRPIPIFESKC